MNAIANRFPSPLEGEGQGEGSPRGSAAIKDSLTDSTLDFNTGCWIGAALALLFSAPSILQAMGGH